MSKVFVKYGPFSNQFLNPPQWSKASYRKLLKEVVGNRTLRDACTAGELDLLITAHDVAEGEETFFSFLRGRGHNVYASVLLRAAMEATMSAPTYFAPLERFVDGGVTIHNCPALASIIEAVQYGGDSYDMKELTVFSFGTGCVTQSMAPSQVASPLGPDAYFWLKWLMVEGGNDASDLQDDVLRAKRVMGGCDYRRFQLSLDSTTLTKLPDLVLDQVHCTDANRLRELADEELGSVSLDNVAYMPVMRVLGESAVQYLRQRAFERKQPLFETDLIDERGRDLLVTRVGDTTGIATRLSDPEWLDRQPS